MRATQTASCAYSLTFPVIASRRSAVRIRSDSTTPNQNVRAGISASHATKTGNMSDLRQSIGNIPTDKSAFVARRRLHQGWWRAFVLALPQGPWPGKRGEVSCNTIPSTSAGIDKEVAPNFLTPAASRAAKALVNRRDRDSGGIVQVERLYGNLLSSQPVALNFFGHLAGQPDLGLANVVLPGLFGLGDARVTGIHFEYPPGRPSDDRTAFDVAVEYEREGCRGLVAIECKYTDEFSTAGDETRARYQELYTPGAFAATFSDLFGSRFRQLFRMQLLAEGLLAPRAPFQPVYQEVRLVLFCCAADTPARQVGDEFAKLLSPSRQARFSTVTYEDFIQQAQHADLSWTDREWTMLLWARYLGFHLSDQASGFAYASRWASHVTLRIAATASTSASSETWNETTRRTR